MDAITALFVIVAIVTAVPGGEKITDFHSRGTFPIEECTTSIPEARIEVFMNLLRHGYEPGSFELQLTCMEAPQPGKDG